jgi:hypothetical protein
MADQPTGPLNAVDFSTFLLSTASTVQVALGLLPGPDGTPHPIDLEAAHYFIDVLAMIESKTKGNLDQTEQKLIASLIYDLRVAYVDAQKKVTAK